MNFAKRSAEFLKAYSFGLKSLTFAPQTVRHGRKAYRTSDLGEFGLIDRFAEEVEIKNQTTIKGIGDDAAVIKTSEKGFGLLAMTYC